jgi:cell division protein FtsB
MPAVLMRKKPKDKKSAKKDSPSQRTVKQKNPAGARRVAVIVACAVVFLLVVLYPVGRMYYQTTRTEQRLQAQLDAVNARNEAVQAENDALQTEEGVEKQAREDLGWVKEGEEAAVVTNEHEGADATSRLPEQVDEQDIRAPQTWYYSILDTIFFVQG